MENVFEIVKVIGLGLDGRFNEEHSIGLLFYNKIDAEQEAVKLWKEQTTESERKSGLCPVHFIVKERSIK
jgi:hypothetical protein